MGPRIEGRGVAGDPAGGYEAIGVGQLAMAWWAFREGHIRKLDLRCWFACWEIETRRRLSGGKYRPEAEGLRQLVGGPDAEEGRGLVRAAMKRLLSVGLLRSWSEKGIQFASSPHEIKLGDLGSLGEMFAELASPGRKAPVPRRIIRRLAGGMSRSRTAAVIAHIIRCLFYRKGQGCTATGCCKASWIATVFGITERSAFDARGYLIDVMKWLSPGECTQRVLNRDGLWVTIDLEWGPEERGNTDDEKVGEVATPIADPEPIEISGPRADPEARFSGPVQNKNPLTGSKNQKPTAGGPPGFSDSKSGGKKPTLLDITSEDIRDTERLLDLHAEAVARKLVTSSEADRLKFIAAASHARSVGAKPTRLFAWMVRKGRWDFITQADEDEAYARLKKRERIEPNDHALKPREVERGRGVPHLSQDARLVKEVREILRRKGIHADPFAAVSHQLPGWSRERWDGAIAEADGRRPMAIAGLASILGSIGCGGEARVVPMP